MHRALIRRPAWARLLLGAGAVASALLAAPPALAGDGFVIWLQDEIPDEKTRAKAERLSAADVHRAHADLAFPPQPATPEDAARIEALREAVASGRSRWDEFDVELTIARELEAALVPITLIRDKRDLQDIVDARLFQGAAVQKAFPPDRFATDDDAEPFRIELPGLTANRPWVQAMALDPARTFTRADVADGSAFPDLQALEPAIDELPAAELDISGLPRGAELVVDGVGVETDGVDTLDLRPGEHYLHVVRNGLVSGRQRLPVAPGEELDMPLLVDATELEQARNQVLSGLTTNFPEDVKASIELLAEHNDGPIFVAALDEKGRITILPYARGAQLIKQKPVTFVLAGEAGGGVVVSSLFNEADGTNVTAPAIMGHLGFELGIYNFAILGGMDVVMTPANTLTYGRGDRSGNNTTSVMPRPWGGAGIYVLRPAGSTPTMLIAGTYGFNAPAHMAFGGRITFGVPIDDKGTWFRIALGGDASPEARWVNYEEPADSDIQTNYGSVYDGVSMFSGYLRIGLAARL